MRALNVFVILVLFCDAFGRLTKKPQNALAVAGSLKALLNCSTDGAKGNLIEWTYDHNHIVWPPCVSQDPKLFAASSPNSGTDCNVEAAPLSLGDVSGAYVCSDRTEKAVAMIVELDPTSSCSVESVDADGRSATLGCSMSYSWHARDMQFNIVPTVTVSLTWDREPSPARQISHPHDYAQPAARLESTTRVSVGSPADLTGHTCTVSFSFSKGASALHEYATNALSWTCNVKDVNDVADKAHGHKVASTVFAPADRQNVVGKSELAETPFAVPLERDPHADELKLARDQSFKRTGWLMPLIFVFALVIVMFLIYTRLYGQRRYPRNSASGYGFGALAVPLLLILFIGFLVPAFSLRSDLPHRAIDETNYISLRY